MKKIALLELRCVLQRVEVCCSVLQCVAVCCSVSSCVAVGFRVLQCVAVCCSVLVFICSLPEIKKSVLLGLGCILQGVAVCRYLFIHCQQ